MHYRATGMIAAGIWAMALSAQTAPPRFAMPKRFPGVPQFTVAPQFSVTPRTPLVLHQLLKSAGSEEASVCSIPLRQVPVTKHAERMPTLRPPADNIDNMPSVKLPAPPCEEDQR